MHGASPARDVGDPGHNVIPLPLPPSRNGRRAKKTTRLDDSPETDYLERLGAELARRGLRSELITSTCKPRLRLILPVCGGFADAEFEDNVVAAIKPDGHWWYWWPWVEEIHATDDPVQAADVIIAALGLDASACNRKGEARSDGDPMQEPR